MEKRRSLPFTRAKSQHAGDRGLLAQAPAQHRPVPTPGLRAQGDSLPDYRLIPSRSHLRPQPPPRLTPEALHEALQEAEGLPRAHHAPLPASAVFFT